MAFVLVAVRRFCGLFVGCGALCLFVSQTMRLSLHAFAEVVVAAKLFFCFVSTLCESDPFRLRTWASLHFSDRVHWHLIDYYCNTFGVSTTGLELSSKATFSATAARPSPTALLLSRTRRSISSHAAMLWRWPDDFSTSIGL